VPADAGTFHILKSRLKDGGWQRINSLIACEIVHNSKKSTADVLPKDQSSKSPG